MCLEFVFAGLEILARLEHEHAADEQPRLIDHVFAGENIGDIAHSGAARDIHDAVCRQRARRLEALLPNKQRNTGRQSHKHEGADNSITKDDERMPSARRAARRQIDPVGFDGSSRAPRHAFDLAPTEVSRGRAGGIRRRTRQRAVGRARANLCRTGA